MTRRVKQDDRQKADYERTKREQVAVSEDEFFEWGRVSVEFLLTDKFGRR